MTNGSQSLNLQIFVIAQSLQHHKMEDNASHLSRVCDYRCKKGMQTTGERTNKKLPNCLRQLIVRNVQIDSSSGRQQAIIQEQGMNALYEHFWFMFFQECLENVCRCFTKFTAMHPEWKLIMTVCWRRKLNRNGRKKGQLEW